MKRIAKQSIVPLVLIAILFAGLVGMSALDSVVAAPGTGAANITAKAYTSGVVVNTFVKLQSAGVIAPATAASDKIVGICRKTAASGQLTSYAPVGAFTTLLSDEAIAVGDLLTCDANSKGRVVDASQALSQRIAAVALTAAAAAGTSTDVVVVAAYSPGLSSSMTDVAGNVTLDANSSGTVYRVTATAVITLPATVVGVTYTFIMDAPDGTAQISLSPNSSDMIRGRTSAGVNNKDWINTLATAKRGDYVIIVADGAAFGGWNIVRQSGTWAAEG
jgi:hypothetical protein